jgi:CHAT domain-containing protein
VTRLRNTLDVAARGGNMPAFDDRAAQELFKATIGPLGNALKTGSSLVIASTAQLAEVPFSVLQKEPQPGGEPRWLIVDHPITHVPSARAWLSLKRPRPMRGERQALIAWGDPDFGSGATSNTGLSVRRLALNRSAMAADFKTDTPRPALRYRDIPALPETREELVAIATTLRADVGRDLFLGSRATRSSVLAASNGGLLGTRDVVVFATHGLVPGDLPNLSQPALAMATTDSGNDESLASVLTLDDVMTLKLDADFVVLSACNTAADDGRTQEALSGLARGFFYAGGRSLLVTHWAVESESAKLLTTRTFAHYAAQPTASRSESLRAGQLYVMSQLEYRHPAYWAPYALIGDGGR